MDGDNRVKVSGLTADKVTLKFDDDGYAQFATLSSMGAFFDATTERIFEESGKGILGESVKNIRNAFLSLSDPGWTGWTGTWY